MLNIIEGKFEKNSFEEDFTFLFFHSGTLPLLDGLTAKIWATFQKRQKRERRYPRRVTPTLPNDVDAYDQKRRPKNHFKTFLF
jgi:hypothetical protein